MNTFKVAMIQHKDTIVIANAEYDDIVYATFDMDAIRDFRGREDLGKYRKRHAYKHLV